ncbi:PIN domain-containing protein [Pontibacter pudoricolor]|uniref:PIN domain-containing protein n=1 Tax=Pontibacter pudoricolor TaxID=2694930 RepID=UPI0013915FF7|nr:PIN domain-containing protein [Pontibacter pudoricolor]
MAQEDTNHFILHNLYPDINSILSKRTVKPKEISEGALFVMDTNSLLAPYNTGKKDIEEIKKVYKKLIKEQRLYIPAHVLREFARNRSNRISDLYTNIDNALSSIPTVKKIEYPILGELGAYKEVNKIAEEIKKHLNEYRKNLDQLKSDITNWNWSDPVTSLYSDTFSEDIVISTKIEEPELVKQFNFRTKHSIPPGNKDKSKGENAIGDLIIWLSILELGLDKQKDVIFVSNDEKNDWMVKGNSKAISTRFELVDEFYRYTKGANFISITFSDFLESQGLADIKFKETQSAHLRFNIPPPKTIRSRKLQINVLEDIIKSILYYLPFSSDVDAYIEDESLDYNIDLFLSTVSDENASTFGQHGPSIKSFLNTFKAMLLELKSLNYEVKYEAIRQKRDTTLQQTKLKAVAQTIIDDYNYFLVVFGDLLSKDD